MAAGAIPPPLFFERPPSREHICFPRSGMLREHRTITSVDDAAERPAR